MSIDLQFANKFICIFGNKNLKREPIIMESHVDIAYIKKISPLFIILVLFFIFYFFLDTWLLSVS